MQTCGAAGVAHRPTETGVDTGLRGGRPRFSSDSGNMDDLTAGGDQTQVIRHRDDGGGCGLNQPINCRTPVGSDHVVQQEDGRIVERAQQNCDRNYASPGFRPAMVRAT